MSIKASIVMIAYNEGRYIERAIRSVLSQSCRDFELIVIDDHSKDNTFEKIISFSDRRMKVIRNEHNLGPIESRNRGISSSRGKYIFFLDGDCYPEEDWLSEGIRTFETEKCAGVEGRIVLSSPSKSLSEKIVENQYGKEYMTGNIAYRKDILEKVGGFSSDFRDYYEDREIALRILKLGKIVFNKDMIVIHQLKQWNMRGFIMNARKVKGIILLYKRYGWSHYIRYRIIKPRELLLIFFPLLLISPIINGKVSKLADILYIPLLYIRAVYMRLIIWQFAIRQGVFLI